MKKCSVDDCSGKYYEMGFCQKHYQRNKRHGDPRITVRMVGGARKPCKNGYIELCVNGRRTYEHILVAEKALGTKLPEKAVVHHVDLLRGNNKNNNLVICQDVEYHFLLHVRQRALNATGDANKVKCSYCLEYDDVHKMSVSKKNIYHKKCAAVRVLRNRKIREEKARLITAAN